MQATTPLFDRSINWPQGLKALAAAFSLAGVSAGSGSPLPMYAALLLAGWAIVKPLRLLSWVLSPELLRFVGLTALRTGGLVLAAFVLSFPINSRSPVLEAAGGLLFLAVLGVTAAFATRWAWLQARRWAPGAWRWCTVQLLRARAQAALAASSLMGR